MVRDERDCPLRAIFYADFDNEAGRKIHHQYPPDVFTKEHYKMFSSRIIANTEFCDKVAVIDSMAFPWTLATFPAEIASKKYDRGIFRYNVSFVFAKGDFQTEPYERVLQKFGRWLRVMELRFGYLVGPGSKARLQEIMKRVYRGLVNHGEAILEMRGGPSRLLLTLRPYPSRTPLRNWRKIQDHEVPVRHCAGLADGVNGLGTPASGAQSQAAFDLALMQVMPHINGVKHVKKISVDSQVDIDVVKGAVQWALYTNQIILTDVFRYSNVYIQTSLTREYTQRPDFRLACWERIAKLVIAPGGDNAFEGGGGGGIDEGGWSSGGVGGGLEGTGGGGGGAEGEIGQIPPAPHPMCLVRLYALFRRDRTVKEVLREAEGVEGFVEEIDHKSMCSFGVEVGILRRLHCYPLCVRREDHQKDSSSPPFSQHDPVPNNTAVATVTATVTAAAAATAAATAATTAATAIGSPMKIATTPTPAAATTPGTVTGSTGPTGLRRSLRDRYELESVQRLVDGQKTEDALCCFLGCSPRELARFVTSDGSTLFRPHVF